MGIWFECFNRFVKSKNKTRHSPFLDVDHSKYQYSYSEVYLGAEGRVTSLDKRMEFVMFFSVRDGILVKIKEMQPYRVLFEYLDGAYYTNGETIVGFEQLFNELSKLKNDSVHYHYMEVYEKLESIMYKFVTMHFK